MARDADVVYHEDLTGFPPPHSNSDDAINDDDFMCSIHRLKELRDFLNQEAIPVTPDKTDPLPATALFRLHSSKSGRAPTDMEWAAVDVHLQRRLALLTDPLRKRFLFGEIPQWLSWLSIALVGFTIPALTCAVTFRNGRGGLIVFPWYLAWIACMGAIGSVAFIGTNALSVQHDLTFDICNRKLMILRIGLGALFGLILTLPFGFPSFVQFTQAVNLADLAAATPKDATIGNIPKEGAMLLLLPFVLGFSTTLVITVLNKMIDAAQAFFGRTDSAPTNPSAAVSEVSSRT